MSSCAVVEYDPTRVKPISGLHTLAGYRQSHLWGPSRAVWDTSPQSMEREFGVRIKPAESFYGSLAKTFLEMSTTLRQMLRRTFWCLRVLPQVSRRLPWRLRILPQVSRRLLWRLRILPQVLRRLPWRLRVLPQVSRQMPGRLRESRKSAFLHFGAYKTVASISKGSLAVTTCYQRHSLWIRESHSFVELTLWHYGQYRNACLIGRQTYFWHPMKPELQRDNHYSYPLYVNATHYGIRERYAGRLQFIVGEV